MWAGNQETDGVLFGIPEPIRTLGQALGQDEAAAPADQASSPDVAAAAAAATADLIARAAAKTPGNTIEQEIAAAAAWARDQMTPWYEKPSTWTWIVGGALAIGAGTAVLISRRRKAGR